MTVSTVTHGPLADLNTVYETPDGRRCMVVYVGSDGGMAPLVAGSDSDYDGRRQGDLRVGFLVDGVLRSFSETEFAWVGAEILRPTDEEVRY